MLEIPVQTCSVTVRPHGRKPKTAKPQETVKEELLKKVNGRVSVRKKRKNKDEITEKIREIAEINMQAVEGDTALTDAPPDTSQQVSMPVAETPVSSETDVVAGENALTDIVADDGFSETDEGETVVSEEISPEETEPCEQTAVVRKATKKKFSVIAAELIAVCALVGVIFLTNAFYPDSAINAFMKKTFSPSATSPVSQKTYKDFSPVIGAGAFTLSDGVISFSEGGAVYCLLDGTAESVRLAEDGYEITVAHAGSFKTVLSGLKYAYAEEGEKVFGNIPVGYAEDGGYRMCFSSDNAIITDYTIDQSTVVWAV